MDKKPRKRHARKKRGAQPTVNWSLIAAEYATGVSSVDLGQKHGLHPASIRKRAERYGWTRHELRERAIARGDTFAVPDLREGEVARAIGEALHHLRQRFMNTGAHVANEGIQYVADQLKEGNLTPELIQQLGQIAESYTRVAKPIFNLGGDNNNQQVNVQVNVLSELPEDAVISKANTQTFADASKLPNSL